MIGLVVLYGVRRRPTPRGSGSTADRPPWRRIYSPTPTLDVPCIDANARPRQPATRRSKPFSLRSAPHLLAP